MIRLEQLLVHLIDALIDRPEAAQAGVVISEFDLDLPVEARIDQSGAVLMTLPRGLLATGFENPLGRLRLHCEEPR